MQQIVEMSQAEYARHRGVSKQAINKQVQSGKIKLLASGKIDAAAADLALGDAVERVNVQREPEPDRSLGGDLTRAKVASEIIAVRRAELKLGAETRKYVEAAGVADAATAYGEKVVRMVRTLVSRAETLHAAGLKDGVAGVRAALKSIELEMLTATAKEISQMAATAAAGSSSTEAETDNGDPA